MSVPIIRFSKKINTVENSRFCSEFVAMWIARDLIVALRQKLIMLGVPLDGPSVVICDNECVFNNKQLPLYTLDKKKNAVNYYVVRKAAAEGILWVGKEDTDTNLADLLKNIIGWKQQHKLLLFVLYLS